MKRKIIKIDEDKCTGCGECVPNCPEGALQIIDGKARLVGELLCDGLGACVGKCPEEAMTVEEREAEEYDEKKVMVNIVKSGENVLAAHLKHLREHGQHDYLETALEYMKQNNVPMPKEAPSAGGSHAGCPGSMMRDFRAEGTGQAEDHGELPAAGIKSALKQWPIQLHLVSPNATYFKDCDLVVSADCVPFTYADFHSRFLKGKSLVLFCPKLDASLDMYLEKLTAIIRDNNVRSISVIKMEVPCCYGALKLTEQAVKNSGKNVVVRDYTISIRGEIT